MPNKIFEKCYYFFWLRMTQFTKKKSKILKIFENFENFVKFHFWPKKESKGFFSEKSDSATFYPLYPPNFMQKIRKNKLDKSMEEKEENFTGHPGCLTDLLITDRLDD